MKKFFSLILMSLAVFTITACTSSIEYTITFDSKGGSEVESIVSDRNATIRMPDNPTKEGFIFDGWFWDNGTFEVPFTANSPLDTPIEDVLTVYAKWVEQDDELTVQLKNIYLLAVQVNAFQGTYEEWLESVRGEQGVPGEDGKSSLLRLNEGILEWQLEGDSSWITLFDLSNLAGSNGIDGESIVLQVAEGYIQWQYTGDLTWNNLIDLQTITGADGTNGTDGREVLFQVSDVYIQWQYYGEETWKNLIEVATLVGPNGNDGLSAYQIYRIYYPSYGKSEEEWLDDLINNRLGEIEEYTVNFYSNGGYFEGDQSIVVSNMGYLILPEPQEVGYKFLGWYTGDGPNDMKFSNFSPVVTNMDLFAKWEIENYFISFELNGGEFTDEFNGIVDIDINTLLIGRNTNGIQEILFNYNINSNIYQLISFEYMGYQVEFVPVKDGFSFVGWYDDELLENEQKYTFGGGEVGNRIFYAKWQENPNPYASYIPNGGSINSLNFDEFDSSSITSKFVITNDNNQDILYVYESHLSNKYGFMNTYVIIDATGVIHDVGFIEINQTYNVEVTTSNLYLFIGASINDLVPTGDIMGGATGSYNTVMSILNDVVASHLNLVQ